MCREVVKLNIPLNRLKHCYVVGKVMETCAKLLGYNEATQWEMFYLGYIHDAMYDFESKEGLHNDVLSKLVNPKYDKEVLHHSEYTSEYSSPALDLLYFADQVVDGAGNVGTFDDRIADILNRHGYDDGVYNKTVGIVEYLRTKEVFVDLEMVIYKLFNNQEIGDREYDSLNVKALDYLNKLSGSNKSSGVEEWMGKLVM